MNILLFGISNVGKTKTGQLLASKLKYKFYDMDEEVKLYLHTTLEEFVNTVWPYERDKIRGKILGNLISCEENKVIAVAPIYYSRMFNKYLQRNDVLAIELQDSPVNIFNRLVFSDENDRVYKDDEYRDAHASYYLREIKKDITYYKKAFSKITNKFNIDNDPPEQVVGRLMEQFELKGEPDASGSPKYAP